MTRFLGDPAPEEPTPDEQVADETVSLAMMQQRNAALLERLRLSGLGLEMHHVMVARLEAIVETLIPDPQSLERVLLEQRYESKITQMLEGMVEATKKQRLITPNGRTTPKKAK